MQMTQQGRAPGEALLGPAALQAGPIGADVMLL